MPNAIWEHHPDIEDVECIQEIEAAFAVKIENKEASNLYTVGDIHDLICGRLKVAERGDMPCLTAMAYRRIRRTLAEGSCSIALTPHTALELLIGSQTHRAWLHRLEKSSGLRMPGVEFEYAWGLLVAVASIVFLPVITYQSDLLPLLVSAPLSWGIAYVAVQVTPKTLPASIRTLGDLARVAARANIGVLSQTAGAARASDIWQTLTAILRQHSRYSGEITRDTRLIATSSA